MDFGTPCIFLKKKKSTFLKKNTYIFSKMNWDPYHPYYNLYIPFGILMKWFEVFPYLKMDIGTPHTFLRKISTSLRKISTSLRKISTFFPRGRTLITLMMTYISLGTLGKWFESFSHFKMDFGSPCTSLRKIRIFFTKISTFFS